ncbi:Hypothetical Protein FCC1311_022482 [Hondaea fermentalgiana]|uniref:TmcB/TmcC TPR repeats domain-containing protein n=1 Tax=Hondaea fermentalgiana TaxID=2315210 RepID=A0A2R5G8B4_9STRA|nr:Hypothetical Protein FCC1311_022482 [Hondaea fermentalgiana]|eukprot:GBG26028.1 Hypothetical Protein FCC1311_022482 [Hondaea fermentalgiana]
MSQQSNGMLTKKSEAKSLQQRAIEGVIKLKDNQITGPALFSVLFACRSLQLIYLAVSTEIGGPWHAGLQHVRVGLRAISLGFLQLSDTGLLIAGVTAIAWTCLLTAMVAYLCFRRESFGHNSTRALEFSLRASQFAFQQPMLMMLMRIFLAADDISDVNLILAGLAALSIVFFTILTTAHGLLVFQQLPGASDSSPSGLSMSHGRVECVCTFLSALLAILAGFIVETNNRAQVGDADVAEAAVSAMRWLLVSRLLRTTGPFEMRNPFIVELILRLRHLKGDAKDWTFTGEMEKEYRSAVKDLPDSAYFGLFVALLAGSRGSNIVYALKLIRLARRSLRSSDEYVLLVYNNKMNERRQERHTGAVTYLQHDQHLTAARSAIVQITKHISQFWRKTSQGHYSMSDLLELANKVHTEVDDCQGHLSQLARLRSNDSQGLRVRAMFLHYIENDTERAQELMTRAMMTDDDGGIGGFAVCVISGDHGTLCKVLEVSQPMCVLFGYSKVDLLGRNINMIIPAPFDRIHDNMVRGFVDSDTDFRTRTRRIYGQHRKGHILPIDFVLTPSTNAKSDLVLVARLKPKPLELDEYLFLVDTKTRIITGYTEGAPTTFHFDSHDVFAMSVKITQLLPNIFTPDGAISYGNNEIVECADELWRIHVHSLSYKSRQDDVKNAFECSVLTIKLKLEESGAGMMSTGFTFGGHRLGGGSRPGSRTGSQFKSRSQSPMSLRQVSKMTLGSMALQGGPLAGRSIGHSPSNASLSRNRPLSKSPTSGGMKLGGTRLGGGKGGGGAASRAASQANFGFAGGLRGGTSVTGSERIAPSHASPESLASSESFFTESSGMARIKAQIGGKLKTRDAMVMRFGKFAVMFGMALFTVLLTQSILLVARVRVHLELVDGVQATARLVHATTLASTLLLYVSRGLADESAAEEIAAHLPEMRSLFKRFSDDFVSHVDGLAAETRSPSVNVTAYDTDHLELVSFDSALRSILSHLERFVESENVTTCDSSCRFVLNNGALEVLHQGRDITETLHANALAHIDQIAIIERYSSFAIVAVLLVGIIGGYVPVLRSFNSKRGRMTAAFRAIPQSLSLNLYKRSDANFQSLQQMQHAHEISTKLQDNGDGDSDSDDGPEEQNRDHAAEPGRRHPSTSIQAAKSTVSSTLAQMDKRSFVRMPSLRPSVSMHRVTVLVGEAAAQQKLRLRRKLGRAIRRTIKLCGAVFYVGMSAWMTLTFIFVTLSLRSNMWTHTAHLSSSTYVAAVRAVDRDEVNFWGIAPLEPSADGVVASAWGHRDSNERLEPAATALALSNRALKFGSETLRLSPFMLTSGEEFELNFATGCLDRCLANTENLVSDGTITDASDASDEEDEEDEEDEITRRLRNGLVLALDYFVREARIFGQMRLPSAATSEEEKAAKQSAFLGDIHANLMLSDALLHSVDNYYTSLVQATKSFNLGEVKGLVLLFFLLLAGHVICKRAVYALEQDMNKIYYLLSILPEDVFLRVPQFIMLLEE